MNKIKLRSMLEQFFVEDIGERDISTDLIFGNVERGEISFIAKEDGLFCGEEVISVGFEILSKENQVEQFVHDGMPFNKGDILAKVTGKIADLLTGERVVLNLVQRMCGVATMTKRAVSQLNSSHTRICDTRKTTPGLRMLEKYAVRIGGGFNHRIGLYDGVMIKDNHITFAGSITEAVTKARAGLGHMVKIEVETETLEQVREAINAGADVIMFDNRTPQEITEWIKIVPDTIITEASGGITMENIASYSETGVDYISLGFLTHSAKAVDISVKVSIAAC
ncbi:carboxylating nicotinate-nucleotide diphosphorylase [Bacillus sp. DNRA2]|uniref:carboxylating nicotinate-nucleotide diphosphorylase n=1 Tax=Bacillus sp. DNRA2 TaxID=2723053 RepID=UPI00145C68C7|nr:carboxylating nicotinate-nucleotide diphosphorylase [Bacillus sp. DNRA2]NMD69891.1 carboxylating nicotinate-nucleotide diphosphorylase [Bacillus sp. DNRA2]